MVAADVIVAAALGLALALLLLAAASDIATMQIPNWISVAAAAAYPPLALATGQDPTTVAMHVGCGLLVFAVGFGLFHVNVLGGGDVKVFAAAAVWTGFSSLLGFLSITFIAGGVLAALMLVTRRFVTPGPDLPIFLNRLVDKRRGIPYAVAIAFGGVATALSWPIAAGLLA